MNSVAPFEFERPSRVVAEGRILFALMDAAEAAGALAGFPFREQWREISRAVENTTSYEKSAPKLYDLMLALYASGILADTWIEKRFLSVRARIEDAPRFSSPPFPVRNL